MPPDSVLPLWSGSASGLRGRDPDLADLQRLLSSPPHSAVVLGPPGAGKSAVLDAVCAAARKEGRITLSVAGHVSDGALPYAALTELLLSTDPGSRRAERDRSDRIGRLLRGEVESSPTAALTMRLEVLAWLESLAAGRRVLVTVDDAQWVDPSSLQVLAFLAHRVGQLPIALVFAARTERPPIQLVDIPAVRLEPLGYGDASALLRDAAPDLDAVQRGVVLELAAGNPLAILELGRAGRSPATMSLRDIDVSQRLARSFSRDLPALPETTRAVLLLAAAGGEDLSALAGSGDPDAMLEALAPAERAGLISVSGHRVRFRHPLVQQAVYTDATALDRVRAHRRLAEAYHQDPDRRAWHRASAALEPDEATAAELAAAARRAMDRLAYGEATRALRRAVELTPDQHLRELRTLLLIEAGTPAGQAGVQLDLARRIHAETKDPVVRAAAQQLIAFALTQTLDQRAAREALEEAITESAALRREDAWSSLTSLAVLVYQTAGDPTVLLEWTRRLGMQDDEHPLVTASRLWIRAAAEPAARPEDLIAAVESAGPLAAGTPPMVVGIRAMLLGSTAWLLDLPARALIELEHARSLLGPAGLQELVPTLVCIAEVHLDRIALDDVDETARMLFEIADAQGLDYQRAVAQRASAAAAALRGQGPEARRTADAVFQRIDLTACTALEIGLRLALADSWAGEDEQLRWEQLRGAFATDGSPRHGRLSVRALAPAVIAAVHVGRADEGQQLLDATLRAVPEPAGVWQTMAFDTARALLAKDADADALFRRVIDDPAHAAWPFELAVARLEYGRWLRRRRRLPEAQNQLVPALRTFDRLGTAPWAAGAREQLRRAGGSPAAADVSVWSSLTPQERQIVRLAATGRTNREIGEALFLSPRTVGVHLYNAFPKLGVTARRQLRDLVERFDH